MKKIFYKDIERFVQDGNYEVDVEIPFLYDNLDRCGKFWDLELNPDFQRPIVWDNERCIKYIEYILKGGKSGRVIYFNCSDFGEYIDRKAKFQCVDGQQRLNAIKKFLNGEIKVFGHHFKDFAESIFSRNTIRININNLKTKKEVLKWYLGINAGGVPHTEEEIKRIEKMITKENNNV